MTSIDDVMIEITPQVLLKAYACGIFPMAESAEDNALYWIEPERRGVPPRWRGPGARRGQRALLRRARAAGHPAARPRACAAQARPHHQARRLRGQGRQRLPRY